MQRNKRTIRNIKRQLREFAEHFICMSEHRLHRLINKIKEIKRSIYMKEEEKQIELEHVECVRRRVNKMINGRIP